MIIGVYGAKSMKYIKTTDLDLQKTFFHFTRIDNRDNIEMNGLMAVAGGENNAKNDKNNPTIYFSYGVGGLLKAVDVWIRWEYYLLASQHHIDVPTKNIRQDILFKAFEKVYHDFKHRNYLALHLVEGNDAQTSDFSFSGIDKKKEASYNVYLASLQDYQQGRSTVMPTYPHPDMAWLYGTYSDFSNGNVLQEDWNMNTHVGERVIAPDRIKMIESTHGRTDALSIILELYQTHRALLGNIDVSVLDSFVQYASNKYKSEENSEQTNPCLKRGNV